LKQWFATPRHSLSHFVAVTICTMTMAAFAQDADDQIVFVCEHGSVRSLIAASLFDRAAGKRRLPYRGVSRGISPEEHVPPRNAAALRNDDFEVEGFRPQGLATEDVSSARQVIAIGVDLSGHANETSAPIQSWDDVPPASVDYPAARAALQRHIDELLDDLQKAERAP